MEQIFESLTKVLTVESEINSIWHRAGNVWLFVIGLKSFTENKTETKSSEQREIDRFFTLKIITCRDSSVVILIIEYQQGWGSD